MNGGPWSKIFSGRNGKPSPLRKFYTVGMLSRILGAASRTISKWIDSGKLKGYRLPGSDDRRVGRAALLKFIRENKMPVCAPGELGTATVLTLGLQNGEESACSEVAAAIDGWPVDVRFFSRFWDLARSLGEMMPTVAVLDVSIGVAAVIDVCRGLRSEPWPPRIIVIDDEIDDNATRLSEAGADKVLRRPVTEADLASAVRKALVESLS